MPHKVILQHSKANLRKRLMLGTVSLSFILISTLCFIGHGILLEMEQAFEKDTFHRHAKHVLARIANDTPLAAMSMPPDVVLVSMGNTQVYPQQKPLPTLLSLATTVNSDSFFALNKRRYYVKKYTTQQSPKAVVIVWQAYELSGISSRIINQLTLAGFILFGLAVWVAMIMSAFIAKRFEKANQTLEQLALQDPLTHLLNRHALLASKHFNLAHGALFFFDLDRFRDINDALGHEMGDRMLFAFAQRLKTLAGPTAYTYRYRSDEFVIWQPDILQEDVLSHAFRLLYDCRDPLQIGNSAFEIGCSIGVACLPDHGQRPDTLVRNAENAMHRAKKLRLGVQMYSDRLALNSTIKVTLRSQLRSALQNQEFILYYQPKAEIGSGRLIGVEAIVRWQHPDEGLLVPALFIDLIEQSGIVHAFTRYTVEQAVAQIQSWSSQGHFVPVSVNLSAYNLMDSEFIPFIKHCLETTNIDPALLEFELTESATMVDIEVSKRVLTAFREMGIKTSIDDFGTGMSSFAYLRELDINTVKLDQSFIRDLEPNSRTAKIVESIVSLCRNLDIDVIAEGVETKAQAQLLTKLDCHFAQGYLYGKPTPAKNITTLMQSSFSNKRRLSR
ncbi:bifunctional diguanylate cyclase/phosphodiesterase [Alteromonas sp. C1M14]|uniref:putative bifunctional diguanylate cyclase/phosphodiesterase n=1 Tax=Alteromonas sp. C1M14 TaxID=2841567 RepID=UPI001C095551|nr:bifunctional diguanylate cyclase/phosphodiesterase [Alteromonas sp. C1M14]MBU2977166.1 bifunctional diguanylate cyclase/phosphodiesterase [Alteromonas sp. C1M14]